MAKKVKNLLVRLGKAYIDGYAKMYYPAIKAGCHPYCF